MPLEFAQLGIAQLLSIFYLLHTEKKKSRFSSFVINTKDVYKYMLLSHNNVHIFFLFLCSNVQSLANVKIYFWTPFWSQKDRIIYNPQVEKALGIYFNLPSRPVWIHSQAPSQEISHWSSAYGRSPPAHTWTTLIHGLPPALFTQLKHRLTAVCPASAILTSPIAALQKTSALSLLTILPLFIFTCLFFYF